MATLFILPSISLFLTITTAMPWLEPSATSVNVMASAGISLRPTEAPGLNGIPKELLRRQVSQLPSTPPDNWCGFITGDPSEYPRTAHAIAQAKTLFIRQRSILCLDQNLRLLKLCRGLL
ncbi:MAG: hypothetical protein LQ347_001815 [Umbilicaria vellea]|nr:MAG: hypothetical protein LQ347_001815 [Umbilicaria vellea]